MTLQYWWHRWASLSFTPQITVALWWCQADNGQVHLYREWVGRNIPAETVGVELAKISDADAAKITIWTAPELFDPGQHKSLAQQISEGIQQEYGPNTAFLYMSTYEEAGNASAEQRASALERRKAQLQELRATLRPVTEDEEAGRQHLKELFRTQPFENETSIAFDPEIARELTQRQDERLYIEYMLACDRQPPTLPKLRVWSCCERAIKALAGAHRAKSEPDNTLQVREGTVAEKAVLYGILAHLGGQAQEPLESFRARRLARAASHTDDQARLFMVGQKAEWDYNKKNQQRKYRFQALDPQRRQRMFVQ